MEYVPFGATGRQVSRLGYGGAVVGLKNYLADYDPEDARQRAEMIEGIQRAAELGVNYFDTAPGYGAGQGERIYGEALAGAERESLFIATKLGHDFAPGAVERSVEKSLKALKMDYVDLLQIHGSSYKPDEVKNILRPGGFADDMLEMKRQGLVKHIGFTTEDNSAAVYDLISDGRFEMYQICYNIFFQHPYDPNRPFGSMLEAEKQNMGVVTMRSATSGMFMRWMKKVDPGNPRDYTRDLIQFVFSNPLVDVVLVGMRNAGEVERNVEIWRDKGGRIDIMKDMFTYYQ